MANLDSRTPASQSAFSIYNISNPANIDTISHTVFPGYVSDVALQDSLAIVCSSDSLRVMNITDPSLPVQMGYHSVPGYAGKIAITDTTVVFVDHGPEPQFKSAAAAPGDLQVFNIANPTAPILTGLIPVPPAVTGLAILDSLIFCTNHTGVGDGLQILRLSADATMQFISSYETAGWAEAAVAVNDTLLLLATWAGLEFVNITDPSNLTRLRVFSSAAPGMDVIVDGQYAYVAAYIYGTRVFDLRDTTDSPIATIPTGDRAIHLAILNRLLIVANSDAGASTWDISDPSQPVSLGNLPSATVVNSLSISGYRLYASTGSGVSLYQLADSVALPTYLGRFNPALPYSILGLNQYAFVGEGWDGVRVIDFSDPANPVELQWYNTPGVIGGADALAAINDHLLVADRFSLLDLYNGVLTDVAEQESLLPQTAYLHQNYPNPFNPRTVIEFSLPRNTDWKLTIHNILGQTVRTFKGNDHGDVEIAWDASGQASGIYLYKLQTPEHTLSRKMLLIK